MGRPPENTDYTASDSGGRDHPCQLGHSGTATLTITPVDDTVVEGDETIAVSGTVTVAAGFTVTDANITLTDDDKGTTTPGDLDSAELSISGPKSAVSEGSNASFTVTLSNAVAAEVTVAWSARPGRRLCRGRLRLGRPRTGTVTFAANSAAGATQTISIGVTDDKLSETSETFTVTLGYDHLDAVVTGVGQERRWERDEHNSRERPDHREADRPDRR